MDHGRILEMGTVDELIAARFHERAVRFDRLDGVERAEIVMCNDDTPGVIGNIGTILGRHGVNIANFALGREGDRAVGVVIVDETSPIQETVLEELRSVKAIRETRVVRV
jgi:D-3-phosphoglycerate dehydrogenase